jgi:molybdopterin/thiamine biosynthesis adenylyltransferase
MKNIAVIGCGGINSWAIKHLSEIIQIFDKEEIIFVKIFDEDIVEEKNLLRQNQNFKIEDLMLSKAEVLAKRHSFDFDPCFITEENIEKLDTFNCVILGVDNHKTRKMLYEYCLKKGKYMLDMRAQGTQISFYLLDHNKDMEYYNKKFFSNENVMNRKGSCQLTTDVENDHIENGNRIIAYYGMYGIFLKYLRGEEPSTNEWKMVY